MLPGIANTNWRNIATTSDLSRDLSSATTYGAAGLCNEMISRAAVSRKSIIVSAVAVVAFLAVSLGCSKSTVRTDAQVAADVQSKIKGDPRISGEEIGVQAANGVVTLNGSVGSDVERASASSDAATVPGVRTVINDLVVQQAQVAPASPAGPRVVGDRTQPAKKAPRTVLDSGSSKPGSEAASVNGNTL